MTDETPSLLPCPSIQSVVEYGHLEKDGEFWIAVRVDRGAWGSIGPFATASERQRAHDDLLNMMRQSGAVDLPDKEQ